MFVMSSTIYTRILFSFGNINVSAVTKNQPSHETLVLGLSVEIDKYAPLLVFVTY